MAGRPGAALLIELGVQPGPEGLYRECGQGEAVSPGGWDAERLLVRLRGRLRITGRTSVLSTPQRPTRQGEYHDEHRDSRGGKGAGRCAKGPLSGRGLRLERPYRPRW